MMNKPDLNSIPLTPGTYLFYDAQARILYVGKAKNLRRRVSSYFRPEESLPPKTRVMLEKAAGVETISTATDNEAFLLEAALIKKHHPHYNILLRDDKEYPLFRLDLENPYPRLEIVRRPKRGKTQVRYFGPFSSAGDTKAVWKIIHKVFSLRRCTDKSMKNRTQPCLYHHMDQCPAPCLLKIQPEQYRTVISKIILLLEGKSRDLLQLLETEMLQASEALEYEKAAKLRDQIRAVRNTMEKQSVVLESERDLDAVGLMENEHGLGLGLIIVRSGSLLSSRNYFWPGLGLEDAGELLSSFLLQYYTWAEAIPPQILLPWAEESISYEETGIFSLQDVERILSSQRGGPVRLSIPKGGLEGNLVNLAVTNAREQARQHKEDNVSALLAKIFLHHGPVRRVEVVDISHSAGSATRAGLVVFEEGKALHAAWRVYALDTGGDDYAALRIWAARRAEEGPPWPDLLLIDGGRGQLGVVHRELEACGLGQHFILAAIAKARTEDGRGDRRAGNLDDRVFLPGRSNPLNLKPGSPELLFLQYVRNQAHDFVLGRHRQARTNLVLQGELERIPGFGPALIRRLWEKFGSLQAMRDAEEGVLNEVPGLGSKRREALRVHLAVIIDRK